MMINLQNLLAAVSDSVQDAQIAMQKSTTQNFYEYFTVKNENGLDAASDPNCSTLTAKTVKVELPAGLENNLLIVPTVALTGHAAMALEAVEINLNVGASIENGDFMVDVEAANGLQQHSIKLKFKQETPPEGLSRIVENAYQVL